MRGRSKFGGIHHYYSLSNQECQHLLYDDEDSFTIGGSRVLRRSDRDVGTIVAAGVTLHEALKAYDTLKNEGIDIRVIDLYSIQPPDEDTLRRAAAETGFIITVEDHYPVGGIGEAVGNALADAGVPIYCLAVRKRPMSGRPEELLDYEEISKTAIIRKIQAVMK